MTIAEYGATIPDAWVRNDENRNDGIVEYFMENAGIYIRQIFIPEGVIMMGKEHKAFSANFLSQGSIILTNPDTGDKVRLDAPYGFESAPNTAKVFVTLTDVIYLSIATMNPGETSEEIENRITKENPWVGEMLQ